MTRHETLKNQLVTTFGDSVSLTDALCELTLDVSGEQYSAICERLRNDAALKFETCIDLCGVDYADYGDGAWNGQRFAAVSNLLSITHNWRVRVRVFAQDDDLRVRVFAPDDDLPVVASVTTIWNSADWY